MLLPLFIIFVGTLLQSKAEPFSANFNHSLREGWRQRQLSSQLPKGHCDESGGGFNSGVNYELEVHSEASHGDVCRKKGTHHWICPRCCAPAKESVTVAPYCVVARKRHHTRSHHHQRNNVGNFLPVTRSSSALPSLASYGIIPDPASHLARPESHMLARLFGQRKGGGGRMLRGEGGGGVVDGGGGGGGVGGGRFLFSEGSVPPCRTKDIDPATCEPKVPQSPSPPPAQTSLSRSGKFGSTEVVTGGGTGGSTSLNGAVGSGGGYSGSAVGSSSSSSGGFRQQPEKPFGVSGAGSGVLDSSRSAGVNSRAAFLSRGIVMDSTSKLNANATNSHFSSRNQSLGLVRTNRLVEAAEKKRKEQLALSSPGSPGPGSGSGDRDEDGSPQELSKQRQQRFVGVLDPAGLPHGNGVLTYRSGVSYAGDFVHGVRHGKGMLVFPDASRYDGDFVSGKFHGRGVYKWPDGRTFDGTFVEGLLGKGAYMWSDGRMYEGSFLNDLQHGKGSMAWPDGAVFEGTWEEGEVIGRGMLTLPNGTRLERVKRGSGDVSLQDGTGVSNVVIRAKTDRGGGGGGHAQSGESGQEETASAATAVDPATRAEGERRHGAKGAKAAGGRQRRPPPQQDGKKVGPNCYRGVCS